MAFAPPSLSALAPADHAPKFPQRVVVEAGPWNTLDDSQDVTHAKPNVARVMQNVIPIDAGSIISRPGIVKCGAVAPGTIQAHFQLTTPTGTEITGRITNGVIQTLDWSGPTWTTVVTAANFATAVITISTTARFACVNFNGKLLAHDGVNKPWLWDGTSGAGGLTAITAASVWYGVPAVKDARVFAIQSTARNTFEFSAVNDATTGYVASSLTWSFGQVDATPLTALLALNDALIVFRARSCQAVVGKVTATWSTDGTRAGLSQTIGTSSPWSVTERNGEVWFVDSDGRPQVLSAQQGPSGTVISVGPDAAPMWHRLREGLRTTTRTLVAMAAQHGIAYIPFDVILLSNTTSSDTNPGRWFVIDPTRKEPVATWIGVEIMAPAMVKNGTNVPTLLFGGGKPASAADGFSYYYATDIILGPWDDAFNAGPVAVVAQVEPTVLATDQSVEVNWDTLHTTVRTFTDQHTSVAIKTTQTTRAGQTVAIVGGAFILGTSLLGTGVLGSDPSERKWTVGIGSQGRGITPIYTHATVGECFGLVRCRAEGTAITDQPRVR